LKFLLDLFFSQHRLQHKEKDVIILLLINLNAKHLNEREEKCFIIESVLAWSIR